MRLFFGYAILICASGFLRAETEPDDNMICQGDGFDRCTSNKDCCSDYCEKNPGTELGICTKACGKVTSNLTELTNETDINFEFFPWQAGIYYRYDINKDFFDHICGATLISHKIIVTTAHCVTTTEVRRRKTQIQDPALFRVALGKYYRALNASQDSFAQIFEIKSIEVPENYHGSFNLYFNDIALIVLKTEVEYTTAVRPVCIDVGLDNFEADQLREGAVGKMIGWGLTGEEIISETLNLAPVSFISRQECRDKIESYLAFYVDADKMCAKITLSNGAVCRGNSGGGVFFENPKTEEYYLRGILSLGGRKCRNAKFLIITKLSSHQDLLEKHIDNCQKICKICGKSVSKSTQLTGLNGRPKDYGEMPWHAAIYHYIDNLETYEQICGGTLISHNIVVSAAHCFVAQKHRKINLKPLTEFKVALGKYYAAFNDSRDTAAQIMEVKSIEISTEYQGRYENDIAFLTLKTTVEFTNNVRPACIDTVQNSFVEELRLNGTSGIIIGWRVRTFFDDVNKTLMIGEMPFIPKEKCLSEISSGLLPYLLRDEKMCAGNLSSNITVRPGDRGGGLYFKDPKTEAYYLRGISSFGPKSGKNHVIFTKLSAHKELARKYLPDCTKSCQKKQCDPLISDKLHLICSTPDGKSARCEKPLFNNSTALFSCNPLSYMKIKEQEYNSIKCIEGEWNRPLEDDFCVPAFADCGKPVSNSAQAVVANGKQTEYGQFPWHAAIYQHNPKTNSYDQICGGTLITPKVVVTAAHCFTTEKNRKVLIQELSQFKIELGKYHRTYNSSDDNSAQTFDVEDIELSPHYHGQKGQYNYDIAFVTLKAKATYTNAVRPVCIDIGPDNFEDDQLVNGTIGKVVGWGLTAEQEPSENLTLAEMPFVPIDECRDKIHTNLVSYLGIDKICVGDKFSNVTVCPGDSGGGLVFENPRTKAYYLRGIVSLGQKGCKGLDYALFTKLSAHKMQVAKFLGLKDENVNVKNLKNTIT